MISGSIWIPVVSSSFSNLSLSFYKVSCTITRGETFFNIPLTLNAPRLSVFAMKRGLFHLTFPSSGTLRSQSGNASSLLHFAPFPIMKSSLGSSGLFLLTRLTLGCKFTVLNPSFFFVFASVSDFSSFCDSEVSGGVGGRVGRLVTSTYTLEISRIQVPSSYHRCG